MSSINNVSPGTFPIVSQSTSNNGTVHAGGKKVEGSLGVGQAVSTDLLQKTLDRLNQHLAGSDQSVRIGYASSVHQLTVEVVNNNTGEIVGQFPSKAVLDSEAAMNQYIGMILSKEA